MTKEMEAGSPFSSALPQDNITHLKSSNECERRTTDIAIKLTALLAHEAIHSLEISES